MKILKFVELTLENEIFIIISSILVGIILIGILVVLICGKIRTKNHYKKIHEKLIYQRTYVIDYKSKKVKRLYNKSSEEKIIEFPIDDLINAVELSQRGKFKTWIYSFLSFEFSYNSSDALIVVDFDRLRNKNKKNRRYIKTFFILTKYDGSNKLAYIDMTPLLNLPTKTYNQTKRKTAYKLFYEEEEAQKLFLRGNFLKSSIFIIKIRKINQSTQYYNLAIKYLILNGIYKLFESYGIVSLNDKENNKITVFYMRPRTSFQLNNFANKIASKIDLVLEVNGISDVFTYSIGCGYINELSSKYDENNKLLDKFSTYMDMNESKKVIVFKNNGRDIEKIDETNTKEVERIIKDFNVICEFQPIVHVTAEKVFFFAYEYRFVLNNSIFKDFDEFEKQAIKCGHSKEILSLKVKKIVSTFISLKNGMNTRLVFNINLSDILALKTILSHISSIEDAHLVLCINNNELIDKENDLNLKRELQTLKQKGFQLGLNLKVKDYFLKNDTYSMFDSFYINCKSITLKQNSKEYLQVRQLIERIVKFKKPIVLCNCSSWNDIEIMSKSGVSYFSSEVIKPYSSLLSQIERKNSKKLLSMTK